MKKLIAVALAVALVITLFAVIAPVGAQPGGVRSVFESDIIIATGGDYSFIEGKVDVRGNGTVEVKIEGVYPTGDTFIVVMNYGVPDGEFQPREFWALLGTITIDADGYGVLNTTIPPDNKFVGTPDFVIATTSPLKPQFVDGFENPLWTPPPPPPPPPPQ